MMKKTKCQLLYLCTLILCYFILPLHDIYLMHLLTCYFADSDLSVFVGYKL